MIVFDQEKLNQLLGAMSRGFSRDPRQLIFFSLIVIIFIGLLLFFGVYQGRKSRAKRLERVRDRFESMLQRYRLSAFERDILELENADIDELHFDIMDGTFVPNITMGFEVVRAARKVTDLPLVAHLMIVRPEKYLQRFFESGCNAITVHAESTHHPHRVIQQIRDLGAVPGLAINPATPLSTAGYLVHDLGRILLMAVEPGFAGQRAVPDMPDRIAKVNELVSAKGIQVEIGVDGNVSADNAPELIRAGASFLVLGTSSIFNQPDRPAVALHAFRQQICDS